MITDLANTYLELSDAELAGRVVDQGTSGTGPASFRVLFDRHGPGHRVYLGRRLERARAGDVLREGWLRIWEALGSPGQFDGRDFRSWAFRMMRTGLADARQPERDVSGTEVDGDGQGHTVARVGDAEGAAADGEARGGRTETLRRCLGELAPGERAVIESRLVGQTFEEIAQRAKAEVSRARKVFLQAKGKLNGCLERSGTAGVRALALPDDPAELAPWLDRWIAGSDLAALVAELEAVHARSAEKSPPSLETALAGQWPAIGRDGLKDLPRPALRTLLRNPRLLFDLQEQVIEEGGEYWSDLIREDPEILRDVEDAWTALEPQLRPPASASVSASGLPALATTTAAAPAEAPPVPRPVAAFRPPRVWLIRAWAKSATIAASAMACLYAVERIDAEHRLAASRVIARPGRTDWGWNTPGLFGRFEAPPDYLTRLANAGDEWFNHSPETPEDLAIRLGDLRTGCTRLIVARHESLPANDLAWLIDHAREWAETLDKSILALERGEPVDRVRAAVDATVNDLVHQLRERAEAA